MVFNKWIFLKNDLQIIIKVIIFNVKDWVLVKYMYLFLSWEVFLPYPENKDQEVYIV